MKKTLLTVFTLLLAFSMLVLPTHAVEETFSIQGAEVVLYGEAKEVTIVLTVPTCYGITGTWSTDVSGITLNTADKLVDASTGLVDWADIEGDIPEDWFKNPIKRLTATYTVPAGTADGEYTVTFTRTMYTGTSLEPGEEEVTYTAIIKVTNHVCADAASDGDHICDDTNCGKTIENACADSNNDHICDTDSACTVYTTGEFAHADSATDTDHVCDYCGEEIEGGEICSDVTTDEDHKCDVCGAAGVTEHKHNTYAYDEDSHWSVCDCGEMVGEKANHDFTGGQCECGAEEPAATGLKGDIDLDGDVDMDDLTYFAKHISKILTITDTQSLANAEVTGDSEVTMDDLTKLAKYISKIIPNLD